MRKSRSECIDTVGINFKCLKFAQCTITCINHFKFILCILKKVELSTVNELSFDFSVFHWTFIGINNAFSKYKQQTNYAGRFMQSFSKF